VAKLKFEDENKVYNNLKIIKKVEPRITPAGNRETRVQVECLVCRSVKEIAWHKVKSGTAKSCGCIAEGRRKNITNLKSGMLTAIKPTEDRKSKSVLWECSCDCGQSRKLSVSEFCSGQYTSCGCQPRKGVYKDLKGKVFGRLTVIEPVGKNKAGQYIWKSFCSCGNEHIVAGTSLIEGQTKSCGCLAKDVKGKASTTHGKSRTPEYHAWKNALYRCTKPNNKKYKDYGGRGIKMCDRWSEPLPSGFLNFLEDMGSCNGLTLERLDVDGDYSPSNCIWTDRYQQSYNTRIQSTNTSGFTGVSQLKDGRWQSYINHKGKRYSLGYYDTLEQAVEVRKNAELKYYGKLKHERLKNE